ncbi:hypothetical protein MSG28_012870 [Choristoneura fumiferana]|uniref:Uncharacterized protein n=1 Tax=Choristoneura fumiferana TaxID=7141 RepID=A0ACC0JIF9_CHOFU|nr:hypothetical protein MSG28_012870 [Choristoneura fumiferana]
MAGSREKLLYERREVDYRYERRYDRYQPRAQYNRGQNDRSERPRRKNGFVYEDIYSDFDEAQGRLSLFRPIRPEYLNLPASYDAKYNSLPRSYNYYGDRQQHRKKDYYDFRIEQERRRPRDNYEPYRKRTLEERRYERRIEPRIEPRIELKTTKNVAVCKPLRLTEKNARYWTTDLPEKPRKRGDEVKKNVKFSEVSGCNRKMIVDDPVCGRKVVPVRELEVSLDQMIQNGYFEKHNIPISRPVREEIAEVPNGKCPGQAPPRRTRHLPQVSYIHSV